MVLRRGLNVGREEQRCPLQGDASLIVLGYEESPLAERSEQELPCSLLAVVGSTLGPCHNGTELVLEVDGSTKSGLSQAFILGIEVRTIRYIPLCISFSCQEDLFVPTSLAPMCASSPDFHGVRKEQF